jgi:hypothetical protein
VTNLLVNHIVFFQNNVSTPNDGIHLWNLYSILVNAVVINESSDKYPRLKFVLPYLLRNKDVGLRPYNSEM